jgi:hypothetical protein
MAEASEGEVTGLGRKVRGRVLPRVSAALAQFISPISTSATSSASQQKSSEKQGKIPAFERFHRKGREGGSSSPENPDTPQEGPGAKVIALPLAPKSNATANTDPKPLPSGISQALLQLMNSLQEQRFSFLRWFAVGVYQMSARQQKKNGRVRKGTIIDRKAE